MFDVRSLFVCYGLLCIYSPWSQGPFRGEEMRQWLEAGYFKGDLPISQQPSGPFHPLSTIFQDVSFAFRVPGLSADTDADDVNAREAELQRAKEEAQFREAERREAERRDAERREAEERAMAEAAAARKAAEFEAARTATETQTMSVVRNAGNDQNNSSAQLKMMLGLGVGQQLEDAGDNDPRAAPLASPKTQKQRIHAASLHVGPSPPTKPKAAWGSSPGHNPKKSMSEIQQEEARQTALLAIEKKATVRSSSSGWANVASRGGSSGWQGVAVLPTPAAAVTIPNNLTSANQGKPVSAQRQISAPSTMQQQRRASQEDQHADDFGAAMSPALESWCKAQMTKINGSDDLTLVSFCMTLTDPSEIRQYLTAYLGASPQVSSFAADFINKRGLGKTQQEEWENTKPKKTRKKGGK
jgi:GYF domain